MAWSSFVSWIAIGNLDYIVWRGVPKMADQAKNSSKSKADAKKKDTTTVVLTPDELRAIAGGIGVPTQTKPLYGPDIIKKSPPKP
jgi:hypothetical protein